MDLGGTVRQALTSSTPSWEQNREGKGFIHSFILKGENVCRPCGKRLLGEENKGKRIH